ncbi:MAG: hypothetical protein KDD78_15275, partial [Caldilineaceae bacterium]|nr:hypothetical protein [Caldilineaceae bacterium]
MIVTEKSWLKFAARTGIIESRSTVFFPLYSTWGGFWYHGQKVPQTMNTREEGCTGWWKMGNLGRLRV